MPFITNDPEVSSFVTNDPEVSPEELATQQAVEARTAAVKSRLDPMALTRGAVQGISDFAGQVAGAAGEMKNRVAGPTVPDASIGDVSKVAFEAGLRGASDLGQLGKDMLESQVLDPYRVLRRAVAEEGFLPTVGRAVANAGQLAGPSMDRTLSMLQVFPRQAAAVIQEAQARDAQQALEREALQRGDRSLLGETATALASLATDDTTTAEEIGKAVAPPKDLAQTAELASMVADPGLLQSRAVRLGTRIGEKAAPEITKKLGTPILEMGGKAAKVAEAQQAKGRAARITENNRKAWEEAAQRSDETAPPLQTPPIQLTTPSEAELARALFAEKAAEVAQAGPGAIQRGVGAAGRAAETGGKLVETAAGKVDELADKYEGPLSVASAVAGASSGPLGAIAGSQVPGAVRKVARWSENASRAGTALRTIADADWDSSIPVWRQIAKDPNAPQWLVRGVTANVVGKLKAGQMVETGLRVGSDLGKGVVEGAATDALLTGLDTSKSGEEIGGEAGVGGLLGGAGTLPALRRMSRERKALAFAHDSMRKASESIQAGADPLVVASTPDELMHSSVILEQTFQGMLAGRQDLKVDLMDAAQFAKSSKDPNAAAYFDESTGRVAVNLEAVDAAGRQLHEIGHALMASVAASNPAIIQHFRQALGPDGMARARQDYQQALGRTIPQDDAFIVGELFSEAMANGLRGVNLNEALPVVLGRTDTQSFFRDADVRKVLKDPATLDLVRQQFQAASEFRPAVDMQKEPGVRLRPEQAGNHPALPTETRADGTQGNDFVDVVNGQTRETPVPVVRARVRNRRKEVLTLFPDVPPSGNANPQASNVGVRQGPSGLTEKTGTRLGEQFYATARSFGEGTKNMLRRVEQAIANNETMAGWYQQIGTGDGWAASVRESLGAMEAQYKDFIPFAFKVDKQGNLLVQNYSLTALDRKASDWAGRKGPLSLELWNGDLSTFKADVQTYLKNHAEGRPGSDGIGEMKRNVINVFLVGGNRTFEALNPLRPQAKGKDRQGIVRSYRADRLQTVEPSDVTGYQKPDYSKQVRNLSPQVVPPEQLELNFNKAVNQLGTEEALAPEKPSPAPQAPSQPKDAPTTFSITASRIKRLLKRGPVNPIGMSAATAQDRHAVAALFRNPAFEAMRWVFVKEGKVVAVANTTVRQPDAVHMLTKGLDIDQLSKMAVASGADSLFWTHNHPSGISTPSEPDVRATNWILSWVGFRSSPLATLRFLGHVVTNHTDHHIISTWGDVARVQVPAPGPDKWLNKPIWDADITGPQALARVGAAFANPNNPSRMILFLDPRKYIKAVGEISPNIDAAKFAEEVRKFAIANGASSAVAYGSFESDAVMFEQLVKDGILDDAFIPGFGGLRDAMMRPPRLFETPPREASEDQLVTSPDEKLRFSPAVTPEQDAAYLDAVQKGDIQAAQRMVDEAAKAAGYTVGPVYHGTPTGGFNVFDKRMRGETSGVSRGAFSFTTNEKAATGYSKKLGDDSVRLDAGLRVANDAMRRFDDDVATQKYFSSKGYTSVEDGMLPEFDWGAIDDVPEFIRELRGFARELKSVNPELSKSFIEAAQVMTRTKAVPEVKRVFLRIPENAPVFQATPKTLGQAMKDFYAENEPTKSGIAEMPGGERVYYVADPEQIKSADPVTRDDAGNIIPLSQRFDQAKEDIRFSPQVDRNLVALHNTTEEGIRAALKLGGIPVPSLGITKKDTAFTGFGDITLIADKSAIDPQADPRNKVYNADVYSPRQPRPFQAVKRGARDRLSKRMKELLPKGFQTWSDLAPGERAYDMVVEKGENNVLETRRKLAGARDVQAAFLTQKGIEVPRLMKDPTLWNRSLSREQLADPRLAVLSQHSGDLYDFLQTPEGIAAGDAVRDLAVAGRMSDLEGVTEEQKQRLNRLMEKSYGARGTPFPFRYISDIVNDLATVAKNEQEVDRYGIQDWIREQLTPLKAEFEQWVDGLVADTFEADQKLLSGRTKKPYALDTLVEEMSGDPRAREKGMTYSLGKARSDSAKALPSLEAMRSAKGSLTDSESMRAFKDAQRQEFSELSDRLQYFNPEAGAFERLDRLSEAVGKAAKRPATTGALLSAAGFKRVPDSLVKAVRDFATKLATAPTEYFEAKPQRAVTLNEFRAAVVPESTSPEVVDALRQAGLAVETYADNANRVATVERLSTEKDLLFSPKITPEQDAAYLEAVQRGDTQAAQQMVDEAAKAAGYTLGPLWHGTGDEFTEFEPGRAGASYFTADKEYARGYGSNLRSFYLRADDKVADLSDPESPQYKELVRAFNEAGGWAADEDLFREMQELDPARKSPRFDPKKDLTWEIFDYPAADAGAELISQGFRIFKLQEREGIDSYAVLDPERIKLADPITRDDAGNVIPLSQRFDLNNPDIRFSPAVTPDPKYLVRVPGATVKAEKMGVSAITDEMAEVNTAMAAAATKEEKKALRAKLKELSQSKQNLVPLVSYTMPTLAKSLPKNSLAGAKNQTELQKVFFGRLDAAVDRVRNDPTRFVDPAGYVEFMRTAGVSGNVLMPPPGAELLLNNPQQYVALVTGAYHGPKTAAGTIAAAMSGLDSTVAMRQAIQARVQGASQFVAPPPMVVAMHHLWGVLSRRLAPIHQEASWLRLVSQPEVLEHIQKSIDGTLGPDFTQDAWNAIVSRAYKATAQPGNLLGNSATSNANSFYLMLSRWNGAWDKVSDVYATPSSREMGRRFWSLNRGSVGIKNKVQRFVGLTFGIPGLIMDRWKFVEFFMGQFGKAPQDYFKYTSTGTPEDVASIYGGYGPIENADPTFSLAFYEGMETVLQAAIDRSQDIKNLLGNHPNVGGLHWVGWNAIKNEAVGHSSLDLTHDLLQHSDITPDAVLAQVRAKQYYTEGLDGSTLKRFTLKP